MGVIVEGKNIIKDFDHGEYVHRVLKGVDFEVSSGEFIVILGPSGSGKSTLLNILGGIDTATDGELIYKGEPVNWSNKKALTEYRRKNIGFVFQFYNLLPGLTALENVELSSSMSDNPIDPMELLHGVGMGERWDHYPSKMSGGQQQRVAIARAISKNPDLLLCDEPTGALDSKTSVQVLKILWDFRANYQKSIVMVTHNEAISQMADRVFFFKDGLIDHIQVNERPLSPEEVNW